MKRTIRTRIELTPDEVADILRKHFGAPDAGIAIVRTAYGDTWNEGAIIEWNEEAKDKANDQSR